MMNSFADRSHESVSSQANANPSRNERAGAITGPIALALGGLLLCGVRPADASSGDTPVAGESSVAAPETADSPAADANSDGGMQEVTITGSHITRTDYDSPQPVTAISAASLEAAAPANIIDFAVTLPALAGSTTVNNSSGALSNGEAGVAALNLRNLGTARTLVLVDGQRCLPPSKVWSISTPFRSP
jgi:iron complex outermembrane receptor protein